jgi:hypothetical protein
MQIWRMAMRVGGGGHEMWDDCLERGIAAITYEPLAETDLSSLAPGEPSALWAQLQPTQNHSLHSVAYEMQGGDVIYVKKGPKIVGKGVVQGPSTARAYRFDSNFELRDPNGMAWAHHVPVAWSADFTSVAIQVGRAQQLTVEQIFPADADTIETAARNQTAQPIAPPADETTALREESYSRASPAQLSVIIPRHNALSNSFCAWLQNDLAISALQENEQVDVRFRVGDQTVLAELKICFAVGTRKAIREALGQLFEYNHYPGRDPTDIWLIVLDDALSAQDVEYIDRLRERHLLPIFVGWRVGGGFVFHPNWIEASSSGV